MATVSMWLWCKCYYIWLKIILEHRHLSWNCFFNIFSQCCHQKLYVKNVPIVGHEYDMKNASLTNFSLLIQLLFQKKDELFLTKQKFLTISHITVRNNPQLCDNWRNISGGFQQRLKHAIVDMSPIRCQNLCDSFDDIVTYFLRSLSYWYWKQHTDPW